MSEKKKNYTDLSEIDLSEVNLPQIGLSLVCERIQELIEDFKNKAERLAYAAGQKTDLKLFDPKTKEPIKPFRTRSDRHIIKVYRKLLLEVIDNLEQLAKQPTSLYELNPSIEQILADFERRSTILEQLNIQLPATRARLFQSEALTPIATGRPLATATLASLRPDLWKEDASGLAVSRHQGSRNPRNFIEHYITSPGDITILPFKDAQQIIDVLGFDTAKLQLIFAAYATQEAEPWKGNFVLKGTDIIKLMGWDRRNDKGLGEKLLDIANVAFALDCLLVQGRWEEGIDRKGKVVVAVETSRMWNVKILRVGQENIFTKTVDQPTEVYLTVQPGLWTESFLNRAGWDSRNALYQFGYLAQDVLTIDPYHNELALRLAIHLTIESRFHKSGDYRVRTLLEVAKTAVEIEAARSDRRKSYDLKQHWDNALKLLIGLGWDIQFDKATYPEWLRPESKEQNKRGYLDKLLEAKISIKPIPAIQQRLPQQKKPLKPKALRSADLPLTGPEIRKARNEKGWTQAKLAGIVGISPQLLSHIESGRRTASPEVSTHLKRILSL